MQEAKAARERHMEFTRPKSRHEDATFHPSEVSYSTNCHFMTPVWPRATVLT